MDSEAYPITDITEEPETSIASSGNSNAEDLPSPTVEGQVMPPTKDEVPAETGGDNISAPADGASNSSSSGSNGHLNHSFSASEEELNKNANACPVNDKRSISKSNSSISGDSNNSGSNNHDPAETFQDYESSPVPIPKDVEASTPMTYIEPKVIVVDNGNGSAADSDDTMEHLFHSNNNMALDTTPVLAPTNNNNNGSSNNKAIQDNNAEEHSKPSETSSQQDDDVTDDVTYDEGYGTGKFLPEGETPLLPPAGKSPGLQHNKGKQKLKAKRGSKSKSDNH